MGRPSKRAAQLQIHNPGLCLLSRRRILLLYHFVVVVRICYFGNTLLPLFKGVLLRLPTMKPRPWQVMSYHLQGLLSILTLWIYLTYSAKPAQWLPLVEKCPHCVQYRTPLSHCAWCDLCNLFYPHHLGPLSGEIMHGLFFSRLPCVAAPGHAPSEKIILDAVDSENCPHLWHSSILPLPTTLCLNIFARATLCVR